MCFEVLRLLAGTIAAYTKRLPLEIDLITVQVIQTDIARQSADKFETERT